MEKFEKYWMKEIIKPETKNFIELAGGLCYISSLVKYYRPDITVWATDISPNYLKKKSKKVSDIMEVNIDFYAAVDAEKLPFLDNQFDAIFISHSIHHLCNIDKMLRESYRILRPGGIFLGIDIAAPRIKMLHEKDKKYRLKRALEFGINEKSISWQEWSEILKNSAIPEYTLTFEPGPKTKFQFFRKTQNLTRKIPIWIKFHK